MAENCPRERNRNIPWPTKSLFLLYNIYLLTYEQGFGRPQLKLQTLGSLNPLLKLTEIITASEYSFIFIYSVFVHRALIKAYRQQ